MCFQTADLCDNFPDRVKVADPIFKSFGIKTKFSGQIVTLKIYEDNVLVKQRLAEDGRGKVLVIDGGGSLRCALVGDMLATSAIHNGWEGLIIYGCIRDSAAINRMNIGIKALNTHPLKSQKHGRGDKDIPVNFAGVSFHVGHYVYADEDGVIVANGKLT